MRIGNYVRGAWCAALLAASAVEAAEPGFYVGVGAGQADYDVSPSDGINVQVSGPFGSGGLFVVNPSSADVDDDGLSWSAVLGYRINSYVATELAYMNFADVHIAETFNVPAFNVLIPSTFTLTQRTQLAVKGPALSVLGILPLGAGWETFVRGGVLFADLENELRFSNGSDQTTFGSEEWLLGAGVQWNFAQRWAWRLEYQRIDTIDNTFRNGEVDLDLLTLGVSFAL